MKIKEDISYFLNNKLYITVVFWIAVAAYGYEITHAVIGVDDICIDRYFADGLGLSIGRWPFFLGNQIGVLGLDIYIPFLVDLVAVFILVSACIVWCSLFKRVFDRNFIVVDIWCYIVFSVFFISYSLIAYVFIYYLHNGIALAHLCMVIVLLLWDDIQYEKEYVVVKIIVMWGMLTLAISFYESFAAVFVTAFCIYGGVKEYFDKSKLLEFTKQLLYMCVILGISILSRKKICIKLAYIYKQGLWMREAKAATRFQGKNVFENIKWIFTENYEKYIINIHKNPVLLLDIAVIIIVVSAIYLGIKKKNTYFLINAIMGILSLFVISVFSGDPVYERSTQNMPLFIGFAFFILIYYLQSKKTVLKMLISIAIVILVWNNLCVINFLFYSESRNNERSIAVVREIGNKILEIENDKKVVAFVGNFNEKEINIENDFTEKKYLSINQEIITWGENAFGENGEELINFFKVNGYDFDKATEEQLGEAQKIADKMPEYPREGYILEYRDYIIVKLGDL